MNETLKPKDLGTIISQTFQVYGTGFVKLIALVAVVQAILYVVGWLWALSVLTSGGSPVTAIVGALVVAILSGILYVWMQGALIHMVSTLNLGLRGEFGRAIHTSWRRLASMIGAVLLLVLIGAIFYGVSLLFMLIPIVGIIAAIILVPVGIYFAVRWAFILQAVVVEGAGPMQALSRSSQIVEDNWWRTFGIFLVLGIISGVIGIVLYFTAGFIPYVGPVIATILSTPIAIIGYTLLYYDLRAREAKCGVDQAAAELGINITQETA